MSLLNNSFTGLIFGFFLTLFCLSIYLISKTRTISILRKELARLNRVLHGLDQQAKLIIKGDMELKLYQQEIEDKLNKLSLIKNLTASSVHTLDKENIFLQINEKVINDLGFKRGLILDFETLATKINFGFKLDEISEMKNILKYNKSILKDTPLLDKNSEIYNNVTALLQTKEFLLAPIKVRQKVYAIFIVANLTLHTAIKKSEEETFLITCAHFGQHFDNIKLFEDLYHSRDDLERKIKERTTELVRSLRTIEAINKTKSEFISSVSHELRTPLTSVKGFSSLLVEEKFGQLPAEAKKRLKKIDENVDKLMNIVNALLDISRIESGKMEIKIAPYELTKIIKDVADMLSPQKNDKGIDLLLDIPETLTVFMDKHLIERALINIVNNAIKFTPKGGEIKISCKKDNSHAIISIADTGYGIDKDSLTKIFQEFYRVDSLNVRQATGSGLGLSLVKRIIDTHKEKIWVKSEIGKGTTFYFTLKIVKDA